MKKRRVMVFVCCLALVIVAFFWPAHPFDLSASKVNIPAGFSARAVKNLLVSNRVLPVYTPFLLLVRGIGVQNRLQAGEYLLSPSDSLPKVMGKLFLAEKVPAQQIKVIFPEGSSIYRMAITLKEHGFADWKRFRDLTNEGITASLRQNHWGIFKYISSESLEGYLFPDTYQFVVDASAEVAAEVMLKRFEAMVLPFWEKAKKDTKLSLHETLTLASIIEKEAKVPSERPVIASVFYNRLKAGMPLAADPTVKYALERPSKRVYFNQLTVNSPYNTYKRKGLPPGPICNPGLESIKAAVYPAATNYYFFVARKDGSHAFSKTWQEHQRARIKTSTPTQSSTAVWRRYHRPPD